MKDDRSQTIKIDIRTLAASPSATVQRVAPEGRGAVEAIDYRFLFENAYDAILVFGPSGRVLSANGRASEFFGYTMDELSLLTFQQLIAGADDKLLMSILDAVASGQYLRINAFAALKSTDLRAVEIAVSGKGDGDRQRLCCLIRNIQSGWQTEQNLNTAYHAMDNTDSGIGVANMQGIILYSNRAMLNLLAGGDESGVVGKHLDTWFDQQLVVRPMLEKIASRESWSGEQWLMTNEKGTWLNVSAVPDVNGDDELTGLVLSIRDTAQERRAELAEQQTARNRTIMESFSSICHALGQPATVLLTSIEMLKMESGVDEATKKELINMSYDAVLEMREQLKKMSQRCTSTELEIKSKEV